METIHETSKGAILLRQAEVGDAARLRALRLEALVVDPVSFSADLSIDRARTDAWWAAELEAYQRDESGLICLASARDDLVGMCGLIRGNRPKTRHAGTIWGVYVREEWRGLGIAGRMIAYCLTWAEEHDLAIVKLAVVNSNQAAIQVYKRLGFTVYGEDPLAIRYEGVDYDDLLMAKRIKNRNRALKENPVSTDCYEVRKNRAFCKDPV